MAGGKFDLMTGKTRPGNYINFESRKSRISGGSERGIVLLPLFKADWGPDAEFITISGSAPDGQIEKIGRSIYDKNSNMLLIREALKSASKVVLYIVNKGTAAAAVIGGLTIRAGYPGSRGNNIRVTVGENPAGGYDVTVLLDHSVVGSYTGVEDIDALAAAENKYVVFSGTGDLTASAGTALTGGTDTVCTNADVTAFLDASENVKWNTMCFPVDDAVESEAALALKTALKSKINYLRNSVGKYVKAVVSDYAADSEGIINVTNAVVLDTGETLSHAQACAWAAAADAAADNTQSNTYAVYPGAVSIVDQKTNEEAAAAIKSGEFFFSVYENDNGKTVVGVEYDINSLVSYTAEKTKDYRKNRVIRVYDTFAEALQVNFPPNKYDNTPTGWALMEGMGKELLRRFEERGAVKNVEEDNDFKVDQARSAGDETYFTVGLEAADSAEKLYFTIGTR